MKTNNKPKAPTHHILHAITILLLVIITTPIHPGGYLAVDNTGQPYRWDGPVTLRLDKGPLGRWSKEQADAIVTAAINEWTAPNIPESALQFIIGPDLEEDHADGHGTDPYADYGLPPDGVTPVIYDQFGYYTEASLGEGMSASVVGWAGPSIPDDYSPAPIQEGIVVLNGILLPASGGLTDDIYKGVITHEVGHLLNLDHSQAALGFSETGFDAGHIGGEAPPRHTPDRRGVPTMFPFVLPEIDTLELDDKAWITQLYPNQQVQDTYGSITGSIRTIDNNPFDGVNVVAYSADDPTSMITCVSGYADHQPNTNPSGNYLIPSLPPGTQWIIDVEPVNHVFNTLSSLGPNLDPLPVMPGPPEFINEPAFEAHDDPAYISTTFDIPHNPDHRHITGMNMIFNDIDNVDIVNEIDLGTDELTAQIVPVTPGRYTYIMGHLDPAEPNPQDLGFYGKYYDFYRVKNPAGLQLDSIFIYSEDTFVDTSVFEWRTGNYTERIVTTISAFGAPSLALYLDHTHMSDEPRKGEFFFGVCFPDPFLGGPTTPQPTDYILGLLFSVSDRDPLALKGTDTGIIDTNPSTITIRGRGFKNNGGPPTLEFTPPHIQVNNLTYIDEHTLHADITPLPALQPGSQITMQVTNHPDSGGYGGRRIERIAGEPSRISDWGIY